MKNRRRVFLGLILLAATFVFTLQDGVIGHVMVRFLGYLFGQSGAAVVGVLMFVAGVLCIVPTGSVGRLVRWAAQSREARVERVVREMDADMVERLVERAIEKALAGKVKPAGVVSGEIVSSVSPAERKKLDDVRTALKSLQWKPSEYESIVRGMDPDVPFETLVKTAIKQLSAGKN